MRLRFLLIGTCMVAALAITIWAQQAPTDLSPVMKDVAATTNKLRMDIMAGNAADVAADGQKLQNDFQQATAFFKTHNASDAVGWSNGNAQQAADIIKAAKANKLDAAKMPYAEMLKTCKSCHDVHREQLPDKSFKFK